jgi:hypothetical protein
MQFTVTHVDHIHKISSSTSTFQVIDTLLVAAQRKKEREKIRKIEKRIGKE